MLCNKFVPQSRSSKFGACCLTAIAPVSCLAFLALKGCGCGLAANTASKNRQASNLFRASNTLPLCLEVLLAKDDGQHSASTLPVCRGQPAGRGFGCDGGLLALM